MDSKLGRRRFLAQSARGIAGTIAAVGAAEYALAGTAAKRPKGLLAGAAAVDVTPETLPVITSGSFIEATASTVHDRLFARGLVLDDGSTGLALVIVDSLMLPREMLDEVKRLASAATGIREDHMLIAANHTHAAPSAMGALGSRCDETYAAFLPARLVECIRQAHANRVPAEVGWGSIADSEDTNCRVWIRRPDRIGGDPFGEPTVRAMMHPGYQNPDYIGPCGPEDPELSLLAVRTPDGRPLALLANYSMHYFGVSAISADYYGAFSAAMQERIAPGRSAPPFVAMMSNGTSGDQHWMDYSRPQTGVDLATYTDRVATKAMEVWKRIEYDNRVNLTMAETTITLGRRLPSEQRQGWARNVRAGMGDRVVPKDQAEVYALEEQHLRAEPERELKLQAIRIGDFAITAIPCEVYAITGLKLKRQSPFAHTMNIELANGAEGYIPPPELFPFGGYNTWPARTAGLEPSAEPHIVEEVLRLLQKTAGRKPQLMPRTDGPYVRAVRRARPLAYWPMDTIAEPVCRDISGNGRDGRYEQGVAFFLEGPPLAEAGQPDGICRAAHFAGGRMAASLPKLGSAYSVEFWFWNGLPIDARAVTGYLFSRGVDGAEDAPGDHLGIGGVHGGGSMAGRLIVYNGNQRRETLVGSTVLELKRWYHVTLARDGRRVTAYLDGRSAPDLEGELNLGCSPDTPGVWLGGRSDRLFGFEGKICHVAVYPRALRPREIAGHYESGDVKTGAAT